MTKYLSPHVTKIDQKLLRTFQDSLLTTSDTHNNVQVCLSTFFTYKMPSLHKQHLYLKKTVLKLLLI